MADARSLICDVLVNAGVDTVFGLPGGATQFIFDSLYDYKERIDVIHVRQENAATCAADGYARASGKLAVAMGQGPFMGSYGAFGVMEAYLANIPMLVITENSDWNGYGQKSPGQCSSGEYGAIDLTSIFKACSKYVSHATTGKEAVQAVQYAVKHAKAGRPGPAVVVAKWQTVNQDVDPEVMPRFALNKGYMNVWPSSAPAELVQQAAKMLREAEKPVIIAGNGVHSAKAYETLLELARLVPAPVATTYKGKSAIAETDPLALGMLGLIGQKMANQYISSADVVLMVGTRLVPPNDSMYENPNLVCGERQKIIQIDIDPRNIGWTKPVELGLNGDISMVLPQLIEALADSPTAKQGLKELEQTLEAEKKEHSFFENPSLNAEDKPILPERLIKVLSDQVDAETNIVLDAGNNRMFMAHYFQSKRAGSMFCPGGLAGMGWAPLGAIGIKKAQPASKCIVFCGDGGFSMSSHAIGTAVENNLPILFVIMNNSALGNVRDYQGSRIIASEYDNINYVKIAEAYGAKGRRVEDPADLVGAINEALKEEGTYLLDVVVDRDRSITNISQWI
jgi:acetolactate synthase I/II/III large subunit